MTDRTVPLKSAKADRRSVDWHHAPQLSYAATIEGLGTTRTIEFTACCDAEARMTAKATAKCVMGTLLALTEQVAA